MGNVVRVTAEVALLLPQVDAKNTEPPLIKIADVLLCAEDVPTLIPKLEEMSALSTFHTFPEGTVWELLTRSVRLYCKVNCADRLETLKQAIMVKRKKGKTNLMVLH